MAFVSSTVMKLQLYVQQVNSALEETSQQVLQGLPRVMRDAKMIHQEALMLREKMQSIRHEIVQVEKATGNSMASLEKIDRIKTDLQTAKEALHEADNWTLLATDIEEVFESKNVEKIAGKLVSMQQSLNILANSTDYEDRKMQLEGLKNRLEAIASPQLVQAFTAGHIEESRALVSIFGGMERVGQLIKYYDRCQKGALCEMWRSTVEGDQDHTVLEWITAFYDMLLNNWHKQVKWCQSVFGEANSLVDIYCEVLANLEPSLNDCIDLALKQQPQQQHLTFLAHLKRITQTFANNLHLAVQAHTKRRDAWSSLAAAIYSVYTPYMGRYAALEEGHMAGQLGALKGGGHDDLMDAIQGLGQSISNAISIAQDAWKRCATFTEGCGFAGLIKALKVYFSSYLDLYSSVLRQLEANRAEHETWNVFQMCLTLLQTTGEFLNELKRLDEELVQSILECSRKDSFNAFINILLEPLAQQELRQLVSAVQDGVTTSCLESVTLNVEKFCRDVHYSTYKVIFSPVAALLDKGAQSWMSAAASPTKSAHHNLPDYSFAPQEYITENTWATCWKTSASVCLIRCNTCRCS
ncbi:conserved oligomeric Golgi complex subunit 7 isoform X2 [Nilaparvata lugens]|uniref:conserved oligomeric Golgi complex subunit 7 isoform X2 n=1 Tax=Nilaparvata lugens TaxID=108931 RepID=UPI00193CC42D|nr:conserved oligomeric Golgi complex subunit 7 isoform X2 [Nilaparvata lugens]